MNLVSKSIENNFIFIFNHFLVQPDIYEELKCKATYFHIDMLFIFILIKDRF